MMVSTGIDLVEVKRIQRSVERYGVRFLNRIYTERELAYCSGRADRLAARFAVKEAVGKALGTGIGDIGWKDIEVVNDAQGRPTLVLHSAAEALAGHLSFTQWSISISHTDTHAIGMVVAYS